jgi:hypothetical protein
MTTTQAIVYTLILLIVLTFAPLLSIWALNTLFPALAIPYTLDTWAAMVLVKGFLTVQVVKRD